MARRPEPRKRPTRAIGRENVRMELESNPCRGLELSREEIVTLDRSGMIDAIRGFADQVAAGANAANAVRLPWKPGYGLPKAVVVVGMGGSAIGGDVLKTLMDLYGFVPCAVVRDLQVPSWTGPDTLVIASSYSGNTVESLAGYADARRRGARPVIISTGGRLAAKAEEDGMPVIRIPGGLQPRAALGYSLGALIAVASKAGVVPNVAADLDEAAEVMREVARELDFRSETCGCGRQDISGQGDSIQGNCDHGDFGQGDARKCDSGQAGAPQLRNGAAELAIKLNGRIPVICAGSAWLSVAAQRWKCQINENSKAAAFYSALPEMDHNEIEGFSAQSGLTSKLAVVFLRDIGESCETAAEARRIEVTKSIIAESGAQTAEVFARGVSRLARLCSLMYYGDFVSYYLALSYRTDPTPVQAISRFKAGLAG